MIAQSEAEPWRAPGDARSEDREAIQELLDRTSRPPAWYKGEDIPKHRISAILYAVVNEIARQFNVNVFGCAAWKGEGNTLLVSKNTQIIDHGPDDIYTMDVARQHFADFICRNVGVPGRLGPSEAYPVSYPDPKMGGRPALPPEHIEWEQERENIIEWMMYLHWWQGGAFRPHWGRIKADLDSKTYATIDRHRLPPVHAPFVLPADWDENTTRTWSRYIRSTMDQFGRVKPELAESSFQFRTVYDKDGDVMSTDTAFRVECGHDRDFEYFIPSYMYAKRVGQTIATTPATISDRANALYPANFTVMVQEAASLLPELKEIWDTVRLYESKNPPLAAAPSDTTLASWPLAARRIVQNQDKFQVNYTHWEFPESFISLDSDEWVDWDIPAFSRWINSNPFLDWSTQLQGGGSHGFCIGFLALLQYCWNIAKVKPRDEAAAAQLAQQGRAAYGPQDLYFLSRSAHALARFINQALPLLPSTPTALASDNLLQRERWTPDAWYEIFPDGVEFLLPIDQLHRENRPALNVFDSIVYDGRASTDEDEDSSGTESESESRSNTPMNAGKGDHGPGRNEQLPEQYESALVGQGSGAGASTTDKMDIDVPPAEVERARAAPATTGGASHRTAVGSDLASALETPPTIAAPTTSLRRVGEPTLDMSSFPNALAESTPRSFVKVPAMPNTEQMGSGDVGNAPSRLDQVTTRMDTPVPATGPIAPGTALSPDATGGDLMDMDADAMMLLQHVKKWQDSVNRGSGSSFVVM
ncbi:hypothetical protein FRC08_010767 [Ceratobasidium sp. 394]|nr:hypothetical protein FRC08_010767 [Ceratobasidium sp. 394]